MKRILALILALSLSFSVVGCGKSGNDTNEDKTSNTGKEDDSIDVDKKLVNVEVTIPSSLLKSDNEEELDIDQITEEAKEQGIKKVELNDDETITYTMSKATHKKMMEEMRKSLIESIDELVNDEDISSIKDIVANKTFTEFDVVVDKAKFESSFDGFATFGVVFGSMFYQAFDGVDPDNYKVVLNLKDESTGEIFESVTYPDAFNE